MNNIVWESVKPLKKSNAIEEFEHENSIILPEDLKSVILNNNGGYPSLDIIKTLEGEELEVKALLSFNKDDIENIYKVIDYFKQQYKGRVIPFATEPSGNYFCVNLSNNSIVYWEHETNELIFIANSFCEFINGLYAL